MDKFIIEGGHALNSEITPAGNKNAALPILAACLLTDQPVTINNIPDIQDVHTMRMLLKNLGTSIETIAPNTWRIQAKKINQAKLEINLEMQIAPPV